MPSRTTRSGRTVKNSANNQSKLDALEILARQRRGEKVDIGVKEDEPLFDEVNEDEYRKTKRGGFIVDPDSDEDISDDDFIDDDDDSEEILHSNKRERRSSKNKTKNQVHDPTQRSMKSFMSGSSKSKSSTSKLSTMPSDNHRPEVNEDDILSQMLFDVPVNNSSAAQKPIKVLPRLSSKPATSTPATSSPGNMSSARSSKTKANYEPTNIKRQKIARSPDEPVGSVDDAGALDSNWDSEFDDSMPIPSELITDKADEPSRFHSKTPYLPELIQVDDEPEDESDIKATPLSDDLKSSLEFHDTAGGKKGFTRVYWYDCSEDQLRSPGVVYLFGRIFSVATKKYVSCCTIVKNINRTCYLLIKDNCTYEEVVGEFTHIIAKQLKVRNFRCEKVTKKYAFSTDSKVPLVADYVKVDYPFTQPTLPSNLTGETFSRVLNVNQTPMEKLILDLKLRGPCWLRLVDPVASVSQLTWSRIELVLESPSNLMVEEDTKNLKAPYFCAFSLSLRTYKNPHTHHNEIIGIAGMVNSAFNLDQCLKKTNKASGHFCLMTKPAAGHKELRMPYDFQLEMKKITKTRFELLESERDLLLKFMEKFENLDPDIVVGHDLLNFDYETLVTRMNKLKCGVWSKLGRFKRTELPSTKAAFRYMFSGRVLCDIRTSAMELIRSRSYDLTELTLQVLKKQRVDYTQKNIVESFRSSEYLRDLVEAVWEDNDSIFSIFVELNVIPLALKITNITGNILSRTLMAGRAERNEYLLLHAFHEDNFICPEKQSYSKFNKKANNNSKTNADESTVFEPTRKKAAYSGGLVLEPKAGYYDSCILLMDFNSLYPSIIQEFNICFSTVKIPDAPLENVNAEIIAELPDDTAATGILPAQLKNLVERRRSVKRLMADPKSSPEAKSMLNIEQTALKLTANSMYGCLGFEQSRFYAKHLASLVTFKGREILMSTKAMVEKLGYEVIYGDTDSLMIDTKIVEYDEVIQKGMHIKGEINRTFKLLEIDIDGVYRPLLLLKKKNYAGTSIKKLESGELVSSTETKGLDTVRRDRAVIAKEAGEKVLAMILSAEKEIDQTVEDIHNYLKALSASIRAEEVPNEKFLISKQLNKNPEEYRDTKGIGHVTMALRYNNDPRHARKKKAGDTIDYVVCLDGSTDSANQRAYSLEELKLRPQELKLDHEYYLCQQIHPVMTRICDKLPVTNAYVLAEMLGIEKSSMLHVKQEESTGIRIGQLLPRSESRFNSCEPLIIECPNCHLANEIRTRTTKNKSTSKEELSVTSCSHCNIPYASRDRYLKHILLQVIILIKRLNMELYNSKFTCENADCDYQTRNAFCRLTTSDQSSLKAQPICELCDSPMLAEVDDRKLDMQLSFLKYMFDASREEHRFGNELVEPRQDELAMYAACYKELDLALRSSFINNIDTRPIFSMVCSGGVEID